MEKPLCIVDDFLLLISRLQVVVMISRTPAKQFLVLWRKLMLREFSHQEESAWVAVMEMMVRVDFFVKKS